MSPNHSANSPLEGVILALGTGFAGIVAGWVARIIQRRFTAEVDELPPYPIVLKPQPWLVWIFAIFTLTVLLLALGLMAMGVFGSGWHRNALLPGSFLMLLSTACFLKVYAFSKERITIDAEKLVHTKWTKDIRIDHRDIDSFILRKDWLHIKRKSEKKVVLISLCFQNIKYLNATLQTWSSPSVRTNLSR